MMKDIATAVILNGTKPLRGKRSFTIDLAREDEARKHNSGRRMFKEGYRTAIQAVREEVEAMPQITTVMPPMISKYKVLSLLDRLQDKTTS